ncbi:MAG: hypothetical protein E7676_00720 [Ruminococcaceae bacterium]|nr:hypothetical protein [Oscillospiraceae bacterium]
MEVKMKRYTKSIVALLLTFILIVSSCLPICAAQSYSKPSTPTRYNYGERGELCTTLEGTDAPDYYIDNGYSYDEFEDMSQTELLSELRELMSSTHKALTTYENCRDWAYYTDCENEAGKYISDENQKTVVLLYTDYTTTRDQWQKWNREHVWPQSHGGNDDDVDEEIKKEYGNSDGEVGDVLGGADLHHVRPADYGVNSSRGNKPYGESGTNPTEKYGTQAAPGVLGGTYNNTYFEPLDHAKGDVARIILYVWVRWGAEWGAEDVNDPFNSVTEVFESVDLLLEWCELDPVDTWEMGRNDVVESIQGNRNVFIDYPELAWLIFDKEIPNDMTTPSGEAKNQASGGETPDTPTPPPACTHTNKTVKGAISATCGKAGYSGDTYCSDCGEKLATGTAISATGNHSYGELNVTEAPNAIKGGKGEHTCRVCGDVKTVELPPTCTEDELTVKLLLESIASDEEKIILLLLLGVSDKVFYEELTK